MLELGGNAEWEVLLLGTANVCVPLESGADVLRFITMEPNRNMVAAFA